MLRQLLQQFNKIFHPPVADQQSGSVDATRGLEVVQPLPELSNADLEVLYTQLLEGVQQGRGQQWAVEYLQRMDDRITVDRWIDWLLIFGEKVLLSPAPNHRLARQMIQLGELGIGTIGELSYDIGIRLLTRQFSTPEPENQTTQSENLPTALDSPPEVPVISESSPTTVITPLSLVIPPEKEVTENVNPVLQEWEAQNTVATPGNEQESLLNLPPNVADTGDELWVSSDETSNLAQQLAANLSSPQLRQAINVTDQDWFYQGLQLAKTGDLQGAIAAYNQAININPDVAEYWFNKGLTLFHLQDFPAAIAAYDQAINIKPQHYKSWYNRGLSLGELGEFTEAIACFAEAIAIQPQNPQPWSSQGLALLKLGEISEAISCYDQALTLEPENPEHWYYRGIALAVAEQFADAIASYDQATELNPDFHEVWIDRGVVLFNLGNWSQAIASWDQALAREPDLYLAWYNRGIALENLGEREKAIASYGKAIGIKPDFHLAWYNQAVALFYLDRFTAAIHAYDKALEIKLDYWEAWIGRGTAAGHLLTPITSNPDNPITSNNPTLLQSGFAGRLASYEQGLQHIYPDTHPEGWVRLHIAKGNTYYEQGKKSPQTRDHWHQAINSYSQALLTIAPFSELHLEVLQSLTKVYLGLGNIAEAEKLQQQAADLFTQLLTESTRTDATKKQLALKFAGIGQLQVDLAVEYGDIVEAWEMAEQGKNACLTWLLSDYQQQIYSQYYNSVQQLLNPHTAIIYWHISPVSLHTFIIKDQAPSPILLFTPIKETPTIDAEKNLQPLTELPLPEGVRRLIEFENWLENWEQEYQHYLTHTPDKHSKTHHPWRVEMQQHLLQLQDILEISTITQELEDITHLILIPHRSLHQLPLHTIFSLASPSQHSGNNFTISYLPSVQQGLSLNPQSIGELSQQNLLSIEYPNSTNYSSQKLAKFGAKIISEMCHNSLIMQRENGTKNQLVNALCENYDILHFIGDMINNHKEPQKSALILGDAEQITLAEMFSANLHNYKLITLAAASTDKNQNINSEYVDLAIGLICSGVPYVVNTLWNVESSANTLVMMEFYRRLQMNKSPVTALAEATSWLKELTALELTKWYEDLLNNLASDELTIKAYLATYLYKSSKMLPEKKLYSHPYYWAAYTIKGID
jgi:tetratricopeptide (TPR) repeat protein